jgi:RNA polymerase sigma-70 factor, ECF subfamily
MERELVERARRGDRDAYEALVRGKVEAVHRLALAILGREADAQDAAQEAFVLAWRKLPSLREPARFDAWLDQIVRNACRMSLRHQRGLREISVDALASSEPVDGAADRATTIAAADAFDRAFARLSVDERAILVQHHLEAMSVAEIADRLGIPVGTAKSRLNHARTELARSLERER